MKKRSRPRMAATRPMVQETRDRRQETRDRRQETGDKKKKKADARRNVVIWPCKDVVFCQPCFLTHGERSRRCPVCRQVVSGGMLEPLPCDPPSCTPHIAEPAEMKEAMDWFHEVTSPDSFEPAFCKELVAIGDMNQVVHCGALPSLALVGCERVSHRRQSTKKLKVASDSAASTKHTRTDDCLARVAGNRER